MLGYYSDEAQYDQYIDEIYANIEEELREELDQAAFSTQQAFLAARGSTGKRVHPILFSFSF